MRFVVQLTTTLILLSLFYPLWALVEYGEANQVADKGGVKVRSPSASRPTTTKNIPFSKSEKSSADKGTFLEFNTRYESMKINGVEKGQVGLIRSDAHLQMPYHIFTHLSHFMAQTTTQELSHDRKWQQGNPQLILGINWLRLGQDIDRTSIDLYGGYSWGMKRSTLATSRSDKIIGLLTTKNFYTIILALMGELRLPGETKQEEELAVGTIAKLGGRLGWLVSSDIRFETELAYYTIRAGTSAPHSLQQNITYTVLNPQLLLELFPSLEFLLGTSVQLKKASRKEPLIKARLFHESGIYGNSIYSGLNFSL